MGNSQRTITFSSKDCTELAYTEGHKDVVWQCRFSPNGRFFATASWDNTVAVWKVPQTARSKPRPARRLFAIKHPASARSLAWSPDSQYLASTSRNNTLFVHDIDTKLSVAEFSCDGEIFDLDWVGDRILATTKTAALVLDAADLHIIAYCAHSERIYAAKLADPPSRAFVCHGNLVSVWDVEDVCCLQTEDASEPNPPTPIKGHSFLTPFRISQCRVWQNKLLTASATGQLVLWEVVDGQLCLQKRLNGHGDVVYDCCFSPDGLCALSASADGSIRIWNLEDSTHMQITTGDLCWDGCDWATNGIVFCGADHAAHFCSLTLCK